jgi:predicted deacylase
MTPAETATVSARDQFSDSYAEARRKFLAAASTAGAAVAEYRNPFPGPAGEPLFTDTALLGNPDADQIFIISSGVHGVEGFCGSACQIALLQSGILSSTKSSAILLVHALNPFGFAHLRRTNEDNVDLNRNFVDHTHPPDKSRLRAAP